MENKIEALVEEVKERLRDYVNRNPRATMLSDEEIRKAILLRVKGLTAKEIAKRLHKDYNSVCCVVGKIPRGGTGVEEESSEVSLEEASFKMLSPLTQLRLLGLAILDGYYDVDVWVNLRLIPQYVESKRSRESTLFLKQIPQQAEKKQDIVEEMKKAYVDGLKLRMLRDVLFNKEIPTMEDYVEKLRQSMEKLEGLNKMFDDGNRNIFMERYRVWLSQINKM